MAGQGEAPARTVEPEARRNVAGAWLPAWRGDRSLLALAVLLGAVTINRYTLELAGLSVKWEHVVLLALGGLGLARLLRGAPWPDFRPLLWVLPWLGVTLLASLINAPDPPASLRHTVMIALVAGGAFLVYGLADTPARLRGAIALLIGLGGLEAIITFVGLIAAHFLNPFGTQPGRGGIPVPFGTLWEPNILGSYLAAAGVLTLAGLLAARERRRVAGLAGVLALILAALALSLARGAWLGGAAGVAVVLLLTWRGRRAAGPAPPLARNTRLALAGIGLALVFLLALAPVLFPGTMRGLATRVNLGSYDPQADPSVQVRVNTFGAALAGVAAHPILGNGAGSYAATHLGENGSPGWLANLELHLLYDSGVLGLIAVLGGLGWLGWRAGRAWSRSRAGDATLIVGLLGAVTALVVAYQATEATWLAYTWVYIGLLARAGTLRYEV